jgi:glycosyltransferase involved in cell wall biosynthesis
MALTSGAFGPPGWTDMQSLRILHVTPYFADAWAYGGIPRLAHAMTRGLARRGHHVTVCTTDACDEHSRSPQESVSCTADGVHLRVFPNVSNRLAYRLQFFLPRGLNRYLGEHARDFDVAHLHACHNVPGVIAARHLRRGGVPYVLQPNGTAPRIERRKAAKALFDAVVGRRVLDEAARVVAVTGVEARQLGAMGVSADRISIIANPVDLQSFDPPIARGRFRARWNVPTQPIVLYLGTLTPRKRLDVVAGAFARLRRSDAALVIAGNDMGAGRSLRTLIGALGLEEQTTFTGLLKGRERAEALADATVVVYPSQDEIFGLVPLEALLCGTPAIVADDSGCAEVAAATGGTSVVPVGDVDALAREIERVLDHVDAARAAACRAAGQVRRLFGEDGICAQLERLYSDVTGPPS